MSAHDRRQFSRLWGGLLGALLLVMVMAAHAANSVSMRIEARERAEPVTKYEYGMFIEPIGGLIARTLWSEMLDYRKFFYPIVADGKDAPAPGGGGGRRGGAGRGGRPGGAGAAGTV